MKYSSNKLHLIAIALSVICPWLSQAAIRESLAFPADEMALSTDTVDGVVYCNVSYFDTYNNGETAQPSLPVKYYTFSIPYNAANVAVSAEILDINLISAPATVFPMQEAQPTDGSAYPGFTMPDSAIYNSNAFFPAQISRIVSEGYYMGDNHVVTVAVYPIQYNPVSSTLKVNNEIYLNISYTLANEEDLPMNIASRNSLALKNEGINKTKSIVYNSGSVEAFAKPFAPSITPYTAEALPMYQYCIITSRELAPAFERLVSFKKLKGYDAGIVTMEDILECEEYQDGDIKSGINDNAGKLRAFLCDAYNNGTQYVLLGGKDPHVPIRYGRTPGIKGNPFTSVPSDLYFADINGNWDSNKDGCYGNISNDKIDYNYEMIVGRLLCKNVTEVNNYIDKLLIYELNPGNGDYNYLERCFFTFSGSMKNGGYNCIKCVNKHTAVELMGCATKDIFSEQTLITQNEEYPTGAYIISELKNNAQGYISFHGHGNPNNVGLTDKGTSYNCDIEYAICALDHENYFVEEEIGNGIDCLKNHFSPGISYSISCSLMPYDVFSEGTTTYIVTHNFGESYTLGKNYGGVAFIGNTRHGWISESTKLENIFLQQIKRGTYCIGKAEAESKLPSATTEYIDNHLRLTHNLLGDPEFEIWTDIPVKYPDADFVINRNATSVSISGNYGDSCKIVARNTNGDVHSKTVAPNETASFSVSPNSAIMIYRHNMIPYIPTLCLQNENIILSQRVFANDVKMGANVDGNRATGNISFGNNVDYIIDANGDVEIDTGFVVLNTGKVTINTPGTVTIKGGAVRSGGTLNINAANVIMEGNFISEHGAAVNMYEITD